MGIVKFCSSGSEKLLPVIWYTHIRGVKLHLQYHQNQRVLGLVAASLRAFSGSCSCIGIHTVQHSETGGIVRSVRIRRRHLLSCDVKTIYLYWCHHSGGSAWRKSPLSSDSGRFMVILEFFRGVMLIERDLWMEMFRCLDSAG